MNENAISANVWKFIVEIEHRLHQRRADEPDDAADAGPAAAPRRGTRRGSRAREKPSARSVPISPVRDATLAYIVIIAPMIAPIEKMTEIDGAEVA